MRRTLLIALAIATCVPATAAAQTTALFLDSQPGDWVGNGERETYTPVDAPFKIESYSHRSITVRVTDNAFAFWWYLTFTAPEGSDLQVGTYQVPTPFGGFDVSGNGHGCGGATGRFVVREIEFGTNNSVKRLAVDFEQHCGDVAPALFGAVRVQSTVSSLVPFDGNYPSYVVRITPPSHGSIVGDGLACGSAGSTCELTFATPTHIAFTATPDPGYVFAGWMPPCHGSQPTALFVNSEKQCTALFDPVSSPQARTRLWWNSQPGHPLSDGKREVFVSGNSRWDIQMIGNGTNGLQINVTGIGAPAGWHAWFTAPQGAKLVPGTYPNAGEAFGTQPGIYLGVDGWACGNQGSFVIREIAYVGYAVTKLALDFTHQCTNKPGRSIVASLRYNSAIESEASLVVSGAGSGNQVTLSGGKVCTAQCFDTFAPGAIVGLTPLAGPGFVFDGWQGDPDCIDGTVAMTAPVACEAVFTPIVSPVSVGPSGGLGSTQAFALTYSDLLGAGDLSSARVRFSTDPSMGAGTCSAWYDPKAGTIKLMNDAGAWGTPVLLTNGGTLSNSQCTLNLASSTATINGNTLTLVLNITFSNTFFGTKHIYMLAANNSGANSGWIDRGTWIPSWDPGPAVVNPVSVLPGGGSGATQAFTFTYSDTRGTNDLSSARIRFSTSANAAAGTCTLWYDATTTTIKLMDDAGAWGTPVPLGPGAPLSNNQCTVDLGSSTATPSGNTLTLALNITFSSGFAGWKNVYMLAASKTGPTSGWLQRGVWLPNPPVGPAVVDAVSVSPTGSFGSSVPFTLTYSDSLGATDLSSARVRFGASNVGPGTCTASYDATTSTVRLMDDAGAWGNSVPMGSGTLSNSQCTVNLASSTATPNGSTLTLVLSITFASGFKGQKNIYMLAASATGPNSGWIQRGTWTPYQLKPVSVSTFFVAPLSGVGSTRTFTALYSDSAGVGDLEARLRFGNSNVGPGTCTVSYNGATKLAALLDDAGTTWMTGAFGTYAELSNSQCTLNLVSSAAIDDVSLIHVSWNITFRPGFAGTKQAYMMARSATGPTTGWVNAGTWTPYTYPSPAFVNTGSVLPGGAIGGTQVFTVQYSDSLGGEDLSVVRARFGATNDGPGTCTIRYEPSLKRVGLLDDGGLNWTTGSFGVGTLSNSQCLVDLGASWATIHGEYLTLTLKLTFTSSFGGVKNVYTLATSKGGPSTGWKQNAKWTVPTAGAQTALFLDSPAGGWIPGGGPKTYTLADSEFIVGGSFHHAVGVTVKDPAVSWNVFAGMVFSAAEDVPLHTGSYLNATRDAFKAPFSPGLDVSLGSSGCNRVTGRFNVLEIEFTSAGDVERLAVDFDMHCEDGLPGLFGAVRYNSTITSLIPFAGDYPRYDLRVAPSAFGKVSGGGLDCGNGGQVCEVILASAMNIELHATPNPGYFFGGWTGRCHGSETIVVRVNTEEECAALFLPLNSPQPQTIFLLSDQARWNVGLREVYAPGNSVSKWTANTNGQGVTLNLDGRDDASGTQLMAWFNAPMGQILTPGVYDDVGMSSTSTNGSLWIDGCYSPFGRFVVHEIELAGTAVTRLAIDFEEHCQGNGAIIPPRPIIGSIRVNSTVPASIPLAIVFSGHGRVDVAPSGLVCSYNCTMTDVAGASIQLAATPDPGWSFVGWGSSPACAGGAVTLTAPTECRPTFQLVP